MKKVWWWFSRVLIYPVHAVVILPVAMLLGVYACIQGGAWRWKEYLWMMWDEKEES